MSTLETVLCWVNTSRDPDKSSIWLKPVTTNALVTKSVFLNLPSRAGQKRFADHIRGTFQTHSYQIHLDLGSIVASKSGSLGIQMDFESLRRALIVLDKAEAEPDPNEDAFFSSLPATTETASEEETDDLPW